MYKGLEALERNKYEIESADDYLLIEKELKDKEQLEKAFDSLSKENEKVMKELSKEIEKNRALTEILALHDKWLGNEMSDFEFFTLLSEIKDKYGLSKE